MILQGVSVCSGCALAPSFLLAQLPDFDLAERAAESVDETLHRIEAAFRAVTAELTEEQAAYTAADASERAELAGVQLAMLEDSFFRDRISANADMGLSAAAAVLSAAKEQEDMLLALDDDYMSARADDIHDLALRVVCSALGLSRPALSGLTADCVVVTERLLPSTLMSAKLEHIKGLVIGSGTKTSHVSILASGLQIPTLVGCGIISAVKAGETVYLDGEKGVLRCGMSGEELTECRTELAEFQRKQQLLAEYGSRPFVSGDGVKSGLYLNITDPCELLRPMACSCDGVGLFRSEFLFLDRKTLPSEDEQYEEYAQAAKSLDGRTLTIRTIDIGGDKDAPALGLPKEENPFMGYRAVRICMDRSDLILAQLRAILRAAVCGDVRVMFPMIATVTELEAMLEYLRQADAQLTAEHVPHRADVKVGIMVEVPSAVVMLDQLLELVDFVSIGSNDLVQYTFAADRLNEKVSYLNQFMHPAVLRLLHRTISLTHERGKECSLCGEMAGDRVGLAALAILGLRKFSMSSSKLLQAKHLMSLLELGTLRGLQEPLLRVRNAEQAVALLKAALPEEYFGA